jgi:hypothetical protein
VLIGIDTPAWTPANSQDLLQPVTSAAGCNDLRVLENLVLDDA